MDLKGKQYSYYQCCQARRNGHATSVAAGTIEEAVVDPFRAVFRTPELIATTHRVATAKQQSEIERLERLRDELTARVTDPAAIVDQQPHSENGDQADSGADADDDLAEASDRLQAVTAGLHALTGIAVTEDDVRNSLLRLDPIWNELFPAEQARIVQLLVAGVDVDAEGLDVRLRGDGLRSLVCELSGHDEGSVGENGGAAADTSGAAGTDTGTEESATG